MGKTQDIFFLLHVTDFVGLVKPLFFKEQVFQLLSNHGIFWALYYLWKCCNKTRGGKATVSN